MCEDQRPLGRTDPGVAGEASDAKRTTQPSWLTLFARGLLAIALGVVALAILPSSAQMGRLRGACPWLGLKIDQVEKIWPAIDMVHVVMFGGVGLLLALAFPAWRTSRHLLTVVLLACATEIVQIWVPGRTASVVEVFLDVGAGAFGIAAVVLLVRLVRQALPAASVRRGAER